MKALGKGLLVIGFSLLLVVFTTGFFFGQPEEYRGFWVDAFNPGFKTPEQVRQLVQEVRAINCNIIFPEVRKYCDAYYDSNLEPKAKEIDADFDPLAMMIKLCHDTSGGKKYIEVHPWLVAYRCKIGDTEVPGKPFHITKTHPEWIAQDYEGNKEYGDRQYLDQGVPGVIDHTVDVVMDIVNNYDVDGIHFDYIRYAEKTDDDGNNMWGYNPITVERFNTLYDREGKPAPGDPKWTEFRHQQIRDLLRKVYANVKAVKHEVQISAATTNWGGLENGFENSAPYQQTLQDWVSWMQRGLLDMNCIMNYKRQYKKDQREDFKDWSQLTVDSKNGRHAIIGLGAYLNPLNGTLKQVDFVQSLKGADGVIFYSYASPVRENEKKEDFLKALAKSRFKKEVELPEPEWLTKPKTGIIMGTITVDGEPADGLTVVADELSVHTYTDGTGFYALLDLEPDTYHLVTEINGKAHYLGKVDLEKGDVKELSCSAGKK